ncbi:MAG: ABC transporter ATP-binding protein [Chitinispirillia bacterium]|nr:ABC transporter ATP-binding protein [Chitinispirillia bacterium]MCL2269092.1 ABC transporter ATP-binding protein [Chitinispirillia bacterium]
MDTILKVDKITKVYRRGFRAVRVNAVSGVAFSLSPNHITGFVGPNGAGKTTTIKMIMGLVRPTSGNITLMGKPADNPASRSGVAYVSEQPYFYKHLTVGETVDFSARLVGVKSAAVGAERRRVLEAVELAGREKSKVRSLSKGLQQRLNMACGLLGDPRLLIFDEPMSGLDPPSRRLFRSLFKKLGDEGRTIFFSTHVLEDVEAVCRNVVVLDGGKLRFTGSVASLLEKGTLGTEIVVPAIPDKLADELRADGLEVSRSSGDDVLILIPAHRDLSICQRKLYEHEVFCQSIQKRTMPLENLLYGDDIGTGGNVNSAGSTDGGNIINTFGNVNKGDGIDAGNGNNGGSDGKGAAQ